MDQFRIRLCQFHNDHHEIQQDICTWNHQVYPKYHIYKIFTKNITAIIVGAYYNSKFRIECKNHENHDATQKWNQKWCWISRFDTIQLLHHQEFKPLIMWLRRKVQIRIKISSKKWNLRKKIKFLENSNFVVQEIPWGVNSRLRTKHWPPFWQGEKALSGSHSFMSK